jgi:membrane protease YdiL (CAAX protease family)
MDRRAIAREITLVYVLVAGLTFAITRLRDIPPWDQWVHLGVGALFLLTAMRLAQREPGGMHRMGIALAGLLEPPEDEDGGFLGLRELGRSLRRALPDGLRETGVALLIALVVFPPFALGFSIYHGPEHSFVPSFPDDAVSFALAQVLVVGLPEEALFRGYFQTRLGDFFSHRVTVFGVELCIPALVIQAALFAIVHFVVDLSVERLAVFFPGLLFGVIRRWRDGIGAAIVFHAMSNLYADLLVRGWL